MRQTLYHYYPMYHLKYYDEYVSYWNHFHYHDHYPFYYYYWYHFPEYHSHYPFYYSYYYNYWPRYHEHWHWHHYHGIILSSGATVVASADADATEATAVLADNKFDFVRCKKGPRRVFTVSEDGKLINVFMGDMNDFLNLECLYLMDAVVTVGKLNHVEHIVKIFRKPKRDEEKVVKKLKTPFTNKQLRPSNVKQSRISDNMSRVSFKIGNKESPKSLIFYHIPAGKAKRQSKRAFTDLEKKFNNDKANVLYIVDHLQEKSLRVFKNFLRKYGKYSEEKIESMKYKKMRIFE